MGRQPLARESIQLRWLNVNMSIFNSNQFGQIFVKHILYENCIILHVSKSFYHLEINAEERKDKMTWCLDLLQNHIGGIN